MVQIEEYRTRKGTGAPLLGRRSCRISYLLANTECTDAGLKEAGTRGSVGPASTEVDRSTSLGARLDDVVPVAVEVVSLEPRFAEFPLAHVWAIAVAAAGVCGDEALACARVALRANPLPLGLDRRDREHGRVVVGAHAHEAVVGGKVVDAVRDRPADRVRGEVAYVQQFRLALIA